MLKTKCKSCIFEEDGCTLDKAVFQFEDVQYVEGFCRHKRLNNWQFEGDPKEKAIEEESKVCLILLGFDNNIDDIKRILKSIKCSIGFITQIIVMISDNDIAEECIDELMLLGIDWSLDVTQKDYGLDYLEAIDINLDKIKPNWFLPLKSSDEITNNQMSELEILLKYPKNNYVSFYFDQDDYIKLVCNKFAFRQLIGNFAEPWFNKIKSFENWKNVCYLLK